MKETVSPIAFITSAENLKAKKKSPVYHQCTDGERVEKV